MFQKKWVNALPGNSGANLLVRLFGMLKVPMIGYVRPKVLELSAERAVVQIPLGWRTKNHLNSMYFGALAVGADLACGLIGMFHIEAADRPVSLVFKDMKGDFLRRPTGHVRFICDDGAAIATAVEQTLNSGERVNIPCAISATVAGSDDPVAIFQMTLSLRAQPPASA
jgi:acyl-coenzyme A thioesterase PaaI-like protein